MPGIYICMQVYNIICLREGHGAHIITGCAGTKTEKNYAGNIGNNVTFITITDICI
jgi:hypothetical protein